MVWPENLEVMSPLSLQEQMRDIIKKQFFMYYNANLEKNW